MGEFEWIVQLGGLDGPSSEWAQAVDTDGSVYVAGTTQGVLPGQTRVGAGNDAFVRKYDPDGNEVWTRQFESFDWDQAHGICVDASGVYVTGTIDGALPGQTGGGGYDVFIRKYDPNGNEVWTRQFGGSGSQDAPAISIGDSGVYVAGSTPGTGTYDYDACVWKYDLDGNEVWTRQFGTSDRDYAGGISVDAAGVYVTGRTRGALGGQSAGYDDAFVRKYDADGNVVWTRQFGSSSSDWASDVSVGASGVYVAGHTGGSLAGQNAGKTDAFVRKYDSAGNEIWTRQFGSPADDWASGVSADVSGVYVAGRTDGTLPGQTSAGGIEAFVRKYDADGSEAWTRQFGSPNRDTASGISVGASGVYVTGQTDGVLPGQTDPGGLWDWDAFVRKYDPDGNELWTDQFGGVYPSRDRAEAVDADGNVYVAGSTNGALPGQTHVGYYDAFVSKYDADGNQLWTHEFGTSGNDEVYGVAVDTSGVYVAGYVDGALPGQTSAGSSDAFVRKYDADGNELWTRQFGTSTRDTANAISVDASGVYVTGETVGTLPGQTSAGYTDAFLRKYDPDGNEVWTRQFGSSLTDRARDISAGASGVYVAGITTGTLPGQTATGQWDVFVRKYNTDGNEIWTRQFGSPADDWGFGISVDASGVYVTGYTRDALPGQSSAGGEDAFVRKYDADGNEIWTRQFGTSTEDAAHGISVDASGVYVTGETYGTFPGQTSAGGNDAFMRKYDRDGNEVRTQQFGTSGHDRAFGVFADISVVYIAGCTSGRFPGQTSLGYDDVFVAKLHSLAPGELSTVMDNLPPETNQVDVPVTPTDIDGWVTAVEDLEPEPDPQPGVYVDVVLTLSEGDYEGQEVNVPAGYRLTIDGEGEDVVFTGHSPAFTVMSGEVAVKNGVRFVANGSDAPTIVVTGGKLTLRDCIVEETTGGAQAAIEVLGGTVDLGLGDDNGGNTFIVNGAGEFLKNLSPTPVVGIGNTVEIDGTPQFSASDLVVIGTTGNDHVTFSAGQNPGAVQLSATSISTRTFTGADRLIAYGGDGDDTIQVAASLELAAWLYGGAGRDRLKGGAGNDVILGGDGDDLLVGKAGRDLLIGGLGADRIVGNADDDILIAGTTTHAVDPAALAAIMAEWTRLDKTYEERIASLRNGVELNGSVIKLDETTVAQDLDKDMLTGSAGLDWFFFDLDNDRATDLKDEVFADDLAWIEAP